MSLEGIMRPKEEIWNIKLSESQILTLPNIELKYRDLAPNLPRPSIYLESGSIKAPSMTNQERMQVVESYLNLILQSDAPLLFCPYVRSLFKFDHFQNKSHGRGFDRN